jgi:hypothetical protein
MKPKISKRPSNSPIGERTKGSFRLPEGIVQLNFGGVYERIGMPAALSLSSLALDLTNQSCSPSMVFYIIISLL